MPSIGMPELVLILVVVLIVFGVGRLPEVGGALGKSIREFRNASTLDDEEPVETKEAKKTSDAS
ncbi:MAG: twin-arginine translocase TatA/TatE family subunit [Ardenticatenaceae bacterium]|nr:twin-arginine translocase TatA/TatE family subunit [Ardenticatenaceae bacterium]HBY94494.1 twin-arginine translocase TatA/TatE family subunit [Chloroflexota bacterium]